MSILVSVIVGALVLGAAYAMVKASLNYEDFKEYFENKNN